MSVQVDVVSCNAAITACGKASQWQNAMQLLSHMSSGSMAPDVITYSAAASACEREWTQALQLLSEARLGRSSRVSRIGLFNNAANPIKTYQNNGFGIGFDPC